MKTSAEMVSSLLERRDAYVTRQKQKRRTAMKIASATCAFALVALGAFGVAKSGWLTPDTPPVDDPAVTVPTTEPTEDTGLAIGGDANECTEHGWRYHRIPGNLLVVYDSTPWEEVIKENKEEGKYNESFNIINYVEYFNISREEHIELMGWDEEKLDELMDDREGNRYCPYTYNQLLDAIYGDDQELKEWVFAPEYTSWPEIEEPAE